MTCVWLMIALIADQLSLVKIIILVHYQNDNAPVWLFWRDLILVFVYLAPFGTVNATSHSMVLMILSIFDVEERDSCMMSCTCIMKSCLSVYVKIETLWKDSLILYVLNFCRGNINIYLHFMSLLHIDMTQVLMIIPQVRPGSAYPA